MSLSGSWDSRWSIWATIRLAIWSSTALPRKMIRSLSSREKMSNSRSPRAVRSMTIGTRGISATRVPAVMPRRILAGPGPPSDHPRARRAQACEHALDAARQPAPVQPQRRGDVFGLRAVHEHRQQRQVLGLDAVSGDVELGAVE